MRAEQQLSDKETSRGTMWQLAGDWLSIISNSDWRKNTHLLGQQPRRCRMTRTGAATQWPGASYLLLKGQERLTQWCSVATAGNL